MEEGSFREDLYYRLNVISLRIPPLRERVHDIDRLALLYLHFVASHTGKSVRAFSPAALEALRHYSWPGNLRELRNVVERAVILSDHEQIELEDLSDIVHSPSEVRLGGKFTLEQIEAEHIRRLIASHKTLEEVAESSGSILQRSIVRESGSSSATRPFPCAKPVSLQRAVLQFEKGAVVRSCTMADDSAPALLRVIV